MKLFLFSTDIRLAKEAEAGGVYSIIVDWENKGKHARQKGHNLEINSDTPEDVKNLAAALSIPITVRINALGPWTEGEISTALEAGASIIMLPMATSSDQVAEFLELVAGRAKTLVQIETADLANDLNTFKKLDWDFAYIGLNDLMLSKKGRYIWEPLLDSSVEYICTKLQGREYGFGGVTIIGGGSPLPCSLLIDEYTRLGCSLSFMRRTFKHEVAQTKAVSEKVKNIQAYIATSLARTSVQKEHDSGVLIKKIRELFAPVILVMYSTHLPSSLHLKKLQALAPTHYVVPVYSEASALTWSSRTEIIIGHRYLRQVLPFATKVQWVQTTAAGVDRLPLQELAHSSVLLSRSTVSAPAIARHAVKLLEKLKPEKKENLPIALVLGFGAIGIELARLLQEKYVIWGVKRSVDSAALEACQKLFTTDEWKDSLSLVSVVFLAVPNTVETKQMFSKELLERLSSNTCIINVGRGETIDEESVIELLSTKKIAGYATDVVGDYLTQKRISELKNKDIPFVHTPHSAASYPKQKEDIETYVEAQLERYSVDIESIENKVCL